MEVTIKITVNPYYFSKISQKMLIPEDFEDEYSLKYKYIIAKLAITDQF